jgi:cell division protein FtsZ
MYRRNFLKALLGGMVLLPLNISAGITSLLEAAIEAGKKIPKYPDIRILGIGGRGVAIINHMIRAKFTGAHFIAADCDHDHLISSLAPTKILLERDVRKIDISRNPTLEEEKIQKSLKGSDLVVVISGLGAGRFSGGASWVAGISKRIGCKTAAVVVKPFPFEGKRSFYFAEDEMEFLEMLQIQTRVIDKNAIPYKGIPLLEVLNQTYAMAAEEVRKITAQYLLEV